MKTKTKKIIDEIPIILALAAIVLAPMALKTCHAATVAEEPVTSATALFNPIPDNPFTLDQLKTLSLENTESPSYYANKPEKTPDTENKKKPDDDIKRIDEPSSSPLLLLAAVLVSPLFFHKR